MDKPRDHPHSSSPGCWSMMRRGWTTREQKIDCKNQNTSKTAFCFCLELTIYSFFLSKWGKAATVLQEEKQKAEADLCQEALNSWMHPSSTQPAMPGTVRVLLHRSSQNCLCSGGGEKWGKEKEWVRALPTANIDRTIMGMYKTPICVMWALYSLNTSVLRNSLFCYRRKMFSYSLLPFRPATQWALLPLRAITLFVNIFMMPNGLC